jgi:probable HAF family extracellular repeat protein
LFQLAFAFLFVPALLVVKLPFPRSFKAWLVAVAFLTAVTGVLIAPMTRPRAQSSTTYIFTDLGTLGGTYSRALGINNCGQIVGESSVTGASPTRPFIWRDVNGNLISDSNEMKDLGTLGGTRGLATDINASGLVVGTSTIANDNEERAFRWFDLDGDGTPDPGEMIDLGVLPNYSTHSAFGVNDNGQIVGSAEDNFGQASGFIWNASTGLQFLATLNGITPSHGYAINNSSHVAGYSSNIDRAFVFNGTTNVNLGTFGGARSIAYDINAAGHAVGFAHVDMSSASPPSHAFKWNGIALQDLGVLTGGVRSQAYSINSSGIVVGYSEVTGGAPHAFVHDGTQMLDLNTLTILPGGWTTLVEARGINDGGQIVGSGKFNGQDRAFLLTPTSFTPSCSPTVTVAVSPASVSEDGVTNLTYTFTRAPVTSTALTVNFSTTGTADSSDYSISSVGSVTILANQQSATVTVDPATDFAVEPNETVVLTTTAGIDYNVGTQTSATGTINNDDSVPTVNVAVAPLSAAEDGGPNLVYTFTRSSTAGSLTVNFSVGGTSDPSTDYGQTGAASFTPPTGTVTFAGGSATATVTVDPATDSIIESNETVILTISPDAAYTIAAAPLNAATGTINNDDSVPTVNVSVAPLSVAEDGATNLTYTFTRSTVTPSALIVSFATTGTAVASDYAISAVGSVTIPANMASATVTVDPSVDTTDEPDETVILTVTPDANYTVGTAATGTITDDDGAPTIQITSVTGAEPPSGSTTFVFTLSLTNPSSSQITVNYATDTTGGTATGGTDCGGGVDFFNISSTGLTFLAGETSKPVFVTVCSDSNLEPDETFFVTLSGNSANSVLPINTKGTGTITPQAPVVFNEEGNGTFAVAVDSVTFARGPFKLTNNLNFSTDRLTRVILLTSPLGMTNANLPSGILTVNVAGYASPLPIEHVGPITGVTGLNASFIIVRLPADLPNPSPGPNNLTLTVKMGSATSNATILSITP